MFNRLARICGVPFTMDILSWIFCCIITMCGLLLLKIIFLFTADVYHVQHLALDFVSDIFSILPFLGLYVFAAISISVFGK